MAGLNFPSLAGDQMKSLFIQSRGEKGLNYLNLKMLSMNKKVHILLHSSPSH